MTIPGVDATVALSIVAAVGDFRRFRRPEQLVSYLGLNPRVQPVRRSARQPRADHQAGSRARARDARRGRVHRGSRPQGRCARSSSASASRRGMQIAVVATARKLVCLCWTMIERGEDYAFARPSLTDKKLRALELRAGMPPHRGKKGTAAAYSLKEVRRRELELAEQAEHAYRQQVADWQANGPRSRSRAWPPPMGRD